MLVSEWSMSVFRALGSQCRIIAPTDEQVIVGESMVHEFEQRWSRFVPSSEVCALNETDGALAIVSAETYELVSRAEQARRATGGVFNPLMLDQLRSAGYDSSWELITDAATEPPEPIAVCTESIELFPEVCGVRLPSGTSFDPGGIGKGLIGDLVTERLRAMGARTIQVELGGDVRLAGPEWSGGFWTLQVDDSDHDNPLAASITIPQGGVATSSSVRRSWRRGSRRMHHLFDPATGAPAVTDIAAATVVAPTLWWAEVVAKVVVIRGRTRGRRLLEDLGMSGVLVADDPLVGPSYEVVGASMVSS